MQGIAAIAAQTDDRPHLRSDKDGLSCPTGGWMPLQSLRRVPASLRLVPLRPVPAQKPLVPSAAAAGPQDVGETPVGFPGLPVSALSRGEGRYGAQNAHNRATMLCQYGIRE